MLLLLAAVALGWNLNGYRLFDPDEGRNAEVAREMAHSNDYVVPHLDGLPYLDKPIVYFAAAAAMCTPPAWWLIISSVKRLSSAKPRAAAS